MKTKNIKSHLDPIIMDFVTRISQRIEVLGVVLLGGMGKRGFMDKYSDIDISVFVSESGMFPLPFEFHYQVAGHVLEFNIRQLVLEDEILCDWPAEKKEAYKNGIVVYDETNRIEDLINRKCFFNQSEAYDRLIWLFNQYRWRGQIHSVRTYHRGDIASAHYLLNNSIQILVEIFFLLNKSYVPHPKWVYERMSRQPHKFGVYKWLKEALEVQELTYKCLLERIALLDKVYYRLLRVAINDFGLPKKPEEINRYYWKHNLQPKVDMPYETTYSNIKSNSGDLEFGSICYHLES